MQKKIFFALFCKNCIILARTPPSPVVRRCSWVQSQTFFFATAHPPTNEASRRLYVPVRRRGRGEVPNPPHSPVATRYHVTKGGFVNAAECESVCVRMKIYRFKILNPQSSLNQTVYMKRWALLHKAETCELGEEGQSKYNKMQKREKKHAAAGGGGANRQSRRRAGNCRLKHAETYYNWAIKKGSYRLSQIPFTPALFFLFYPCPQPFFLV